MSFFTRAMTAVLVCLSISATAVALPSITAAAAGNKVRFAAPGTVCQIRVQIVSQDGTPLFDSSWKDGDVLDWQPENLASGSYRTVVSVKNLDGTIAERETTLVSRAGQLSIEPRSDDEGTPKLTLLAHDGTNGAIVSTSGDLSFRFGSFLAGKDTEAMHLTAGGELDVNGVIRASKGIQFEDGTILTSKDGQLITRPAGVPDHIAAPIIHQPQAGTIRTVQASRPLTPRPNFTPGYQFVIGDTGVTIGTTNPAYNLDVSGSINTNTGLNINSQRVLTADVTNIVAGVNAGGAAAMDNSFFGAWAGHAITTGSEMVGVGYAAGAYTQSGTFDTFVGSQAQGGSTGDFNTVIGADARVADGISNATAIGASAIASQSNTVILGSIVGVNGYNAPAATASTGIGTQTPNQYLGVGGGITVDQNNTNNGTLLQNGVVAFGTAGSNGLSGEAIGSQRTGSGNLYGLDFYTMYAKRMSISQTGTVTVYGSLVKPAGSFKIDHPLDPREKYLSHSFVESPDMKNIYDGNVVLDDNGEAVVRLPDWFEALNQDFRYQLTCMHGWAPVYVDEEIANNQFKIAGGKPGMKVSWQVTGIRHDPYASAHRIVVEEDKPAGERGTYLYPDVYANDRR